MAPRHLPLPQPHVNPLSGLAPLIDETAAKQLRVFSALVVRVYI